MNDRVAFRFELSPAELHWLAGAFAIKRLPLPEDPSRFMTFAERKSELEHAPASMQERGLLAGSAQTGWQIDRLPGAIVHWLGSASHIFRLDIYNSDGRSRCAHVFADNNASMQVRLGGTMYEFVIFPDHNAMIDHSLEWFGASKIDAADSIGEYGFPQSLVIITTAWKDPALAAKMLKVTGCNPEDVKSILAWAGTLQWTASFRRIQLDEEDARSQNQTVFCGNERKAWVGETDGSTDDIVEFSPTDPDGIRDTIRRFL